MISCLNHASCSPLHFDNFCHINSTVNASVEIAYNSCWRRERHVWQIAIWMNLFRSAKVLLRRQLASQERSFASRVKGLGKKGGPKETIPADCLPVVSQLRCCVMPLQAHECAVTTTLLLRRLPSWEGPMWASRPSSTGFCEGG